MIRWMEVVRRDPKDYKCLVLVGPVTDPDIRMESDQ